MAEQEEDIAPATRPLVTSRKPVAARGQSLWLPQEKWQRWWGTGEGGGGEGQGESGPGGAGEKEAGHGLQFGE